VVPFVKTRSNNFLPEVVRSCSSSVLLGSRFFLVVVVFLTLQPVFGYLFITDIRYSDGVTYSPSFNELPSFFSRRQFSLTWHQRDFSARFLVVPRFVALTLQCFVNLKYFFPPFLCALIFFARCSSAPSSFCAFLQTQRFNDS